MERHSRIKIALVWACAAALPILTVIGVCPCRMTRPSIQNKIWACSSCMRDDTCTFQLIREGECSWHRSNVANTTYECNGDWTYTIPTANEVDVIETTYTGGQCLEGYNSGCTATTAVYPPDYVLRRTWITQPCAGTPPGSGG
jgi:hypothetical protein